jgi:phosphatidylglycerol lysyltransferase
VTETAMAFVAKISQNAENMRLRSLAWKLMATVGICVVGYCVFYLLHKGPTVQGSRQARVNLERGGFPLPLYPAKGTPKALILFGSGDGGWKEFEDKICRHFSEQGYAVIGWDCRAYGDGVIYTQEALAKDFASALRTGREEMGLGEEVPEILAGYSTGAEQIVPAAAMSSILKNVTGLLVISPGKRGRFGLTMSDLMGVPPEGNGSYALADFSSKMPQLRIVQIHGQYDPLDSTEWLDALTTPHELLTYPDGWHTFKGASPDFLKLLDDALDWILLPVSAR